MWVFFPSPGSLGIPFIVLVNRRSWWEKFRDLHLFFIQVLESVGGLVCQAFLGSDTGCAGTFILAPLHL